MDKALKSVYLKLDSNMKSLTKNAIAQFLIKLIYASERRMTQKEIIESYKESIGNNIIDETEIIEIINELESEQNIKLANRTYYISTTRRNKIKRDFQDSQRRNSEIIDKYFKPYFSEDKVIIEWLSDSSIFFFENYSNEWISNICFDKSINAVFSSKDSILSAIAKRIKSNKLIDKRDIIELPNKFINFISTKDILVDLYLWDYGTSAFAAKLIASTNGTDKMSIDTFKDSICLLDTNILMNIGLESSDYYHALSSVEEVFSKLNIEVGIFNVTKNEYVHTVAQKRENLLNLISNGYSIEVIKELNDQYSQTAISRSCVNESDFERFFDDLLHVPDFLDNRLAINLYDDDTILEDSINKAIIDSIKLNELNNIYKEITGREKNQHSLNHDVGMIAGAEYLRDKGKAFILSQELSVNAYSKKYPSVLELPLAMKLETLINVLAISSGGVDVNTSDYIPLFASMIRTGIHSHTDVFRVEDLSLMLEREEQISQLPSEEVVKIAKSINRLRLLGESDDKIGLELSRRVQGVKLKVADDLRDTKISLSLEKEEKNRQKMIATASKKALRATIEKNVRKEYHKKIKTQKSKFFFYPLLILVFSILLYAIYYFKVDSVTIWSIIITIIVNILFSILVSFVKILPVFRKLKKNEKEFINNETDRLFQEELTNNLND